MSVTKQRLHARLKPAIIEKIQTIAGEENVSQADAITLAVEHYVSEKNEVYAVLKSMMSDLLDKKLESMQEKVNRIQVTGNMIDRDTKTILEFMNHYYLVNEFKELITTEDYKTEGLQKAEDLIQKRIQKQRKKKLDDEQRKEQKM